MLTAELLKAQANLSHLTDDDRKSIASMSEIDENKVIGDKIAEIYNGLDNDIERSSGLKKNTGEKTYAFAQRAIAEMKKSGGDDLQRELEQIKSEKSDLEKQIKSGNGDVALKNQVAQLEKDLAAKKSEVKQWQDKHKEDISAMEKSLTDAQKEAMSVRVDYQFEQALSGLKFKDEKIIPKEVRDAYIKQAKQAVLADLTVDFVDDGKGSKMMVFKKGEEIQRNKENGLQPITAADLLSKQLAPIIDPGRSATGSGQKPGAAGTVNAGGQFLADARTQIEAHEQIGKYLTDNGIARGTEKFADELRRISEENKVDSLPIK